MTCQVCFSSEAGVHCFKWANHRGRTGFSGCHEHFATAEALAAHVAPTGGCRNPENIPQLKWDGTAWGIKEREPERSNH